MDEKDAGGPSKGEEDAGGEYESDKAAGGEDKIGKDAADAVAHSQDNAQHNQKGICSQG